MLQVLGFVLVPIYACVSALRRGSEALSSQSQERSYQEWVAAGIPPARIAREILLARALLLLPDAITLAVLHTYTYVFASAPMALSAGLPDKVVALLNEYLSHLWEVGFIFFAFILVFYMFYFAAAFFGVLTRSTVGRVTLVFGYIVAHLVAPPLLYLLIFFLYTNPLEGTLNAITFLVTATHPVSAIYCAIVMYHDPFGSSIASEVGRYGLSVIFQLLLAYLFYRLAVRVFTRRLIG